MFFIILVKDFLKKCNECRIYKENPVFERELGDFSEHICELDPFRDGKGGERVGTYMRWLLESFDDGKKQKDAIQYANGLYAEQWGYDKVIDMTDLEKLPSD